MKPLQIKNFILDVLFPKICLNCQREGDYLCQDCLAILGVSNFHQKYPAKNLTDLYFALPYQNILIKRLIQKFKYEPYIKELSKTLADLIITHFSLSDNLESFSDADFIEHPRRSRDFILVPVPSEKKRLRKRGFNPAEEIGKELSLHFKIPLILDVLIKIKETQPQVELASAARKENLKGAFLKKNEEAVKNKKVILVDDVYTTGSTMEECAGVLKQSGAKEVVGIAVARAQPEEDKYPSA